MSLFSKKEEVKKEETKVEVKAAPVSEPKPAKQEKPAVVKEEQPAPVKEEAPVVVAQPVVEEEKYVDETGYIAAGTKIEGNIKTSGNLIMDGAITGETTVRGDLVLHGSAGGNVQCENLIINEVSIKTTINVENNVIIDEKTVFTGKINCKNITVYGKVDGDIVAKEAVILKKTATVKGTITTSRIGVEPGAVIKGNVTIK